MSATLASAPALPLHTAGKYVAGAYIVFVALIVIYVGIMARRLSRTEKDLEQLKQDVRAREHGEASNPPDHDVETIAAGGLTRAPAVASPDGERGPA